MGFATKGPETVTEGWRTSTIKQTANEYDLSEYRLLPVSDSESEDGSDGESAESDGEDSEEGTPGDGYQVLGSDWYSNASYSEAERVFMQKETEELFDAEIFPDVYGVGMKTLQCYAKLLKPDMSEVQV